MVRLLAAIVMMAFVVPPAAAQESAWRTLAASVPPGSTVKVRLTDGRRFDAVLVEAREDELLLQPKTRQPVPVQPLPYSAVASLERVKGGGGMSVGKTVAIGAATGGAVFFGILIAMLSALD
ncbi:MAG: hypothetical protein AB7P99_00025 [Vicinamibacterales bacterium]